MRIILKVQPLPFLGESAHCWSVYKLDVCVPSVEVSADGLAAAAVLDKLTFHV